MERLERWVRMYQPIVFRAAYLILRDADAAADVAKTRSSARGRPAASRTTRSSGRGCTASP